MDIKDSVIMRLYCIAEKPFESTNLVTTLRTNITILWRTSKVIVECIPYL